MTDTIEIYQGADGFYLTRGDTIIGAPTTISSIDGEASLTLLGTTKVLCTGADTRDEFEKVFPMPNTVKRTTDGYTYTVFSSGAAHIFLFRWEGWQAAKNGALPGHPWAAQRDPQPLVRNEPTGTDCSICGTPQVSS